MLLQITHHNKCAFMVIQHSYLAIELRGKIHQIFIKYLNYTHAIEKAHICLELFLNTVTVKMLDK